MAWQPLLDGERRNAALAAADAIAAELARDASHWLPAETSDRLRVQNATLGMGRAGFAVTLGYLTRAGLDHADAARRLIAEAARTIASTVMGPAFFAGFTGIAWSLQQLAEWDIARAAAGTFATLDAALTRLVDREDWPWQIDLVGGLAGFLVYALSRLPSSDAERAIACIVRLLDARAVPMAAGVSWFSEPALLTEENRTLAPLGCYNHGISRGVAGIVAALAEVAGTGIEEERARRLVEGGVAWLLSARIGGTWNFPSMSGPEVRTKPARLAWCYGAPGTAAVLLRAAEALGRDDWRETALQVALWAADQPVEGSGVTDAEVCHGSSGLGHIFHRLAQRTGDERFTAAARRWYDHALSVRADGEGLAGYLTDWRARGSTEGWVSESAMVYGAAGIAAALTAACSDVEPGWDAMFLLSDACRSRG